MKNHFIILLLICQNVFSQNTNFKADTISIKTLKEQINKQNDVTSKIELLQELVSWQNLYSNKSDSAIVSILETCESLVKGNKNDLLMGKLLLAKGKYEFNVSKKIQGLQTCFDALKFLEKTSDYHYQSLTNAQISIYQADLGRTDLAKNYAEQALTLASKSGNNQSLGRANYAKAIYYATFRQNLVSEKSKDVQLLSNLCDTIFSFYHKARIFSEKADEILLGNALNGLGVFHDNCKTSIDSSLYFYNQSLKIADKIGNQAQKVFIFQNIGRIYRMRKNYAMAIDYVNKAIEVGEQTNNYLGLEKAHQNMAFVMRDTGLFQQAFEHVAEYHRYYVKRVSESESQEINELDIKYQTEKKELQLKLQDAQLQTQRTVTLSTSVGLGIAAILGFIFFRLNEKNKALAKANAVLVREQNHRIKNNLQVVSSLLSLQSNRIKDEKAKVAIEESQLRVQSMAFIHRRLYGENLTSIDFGEYAEELVSHVVGSYGYREKLSLQMEIAPTFLEVEKAIPLGLVLNELVSNACKYAFPEHPNPTLMISFQEKDEKHWELLVKDNGVGLPTDFEVEKSNSFGMKLVHLQAKQLEGKVSFENEGGLKVSLVFGK
jgi:two-component sensor histidine kinase